MKSIMKACGPEISLRICTDTDTVPMYDFASGGPGNCRITHMKVPEREFTPLSSAILVEIAHTPWQLAEKMKAAAKEASHG